MDITSEICRYFIGFSAAILSLVFLTRGYGYFPLFLASLFLLIISVTDTISIKIPNFVNIALIMTGIGFHISSNGSEGILTAVVGCLTGFALLFPAYLIRKLGAGDVKALAALGTLTGAAAIFQIFIYTSLIGGGIAIIYLILIQVSSKSLTHAIERLRIFIYTKDFQLLKSTHLNIRFPYAAAIAFGYFAYIHWGSII